MVQRTLVLLHQLPVSIVAVPQVCIPSIKDALQVEVPSLFAWMIRLVRIGFH